MASMETSAMQPTVENRYASTVEQSCRHAGQAASVCSTLVSRAVAIAELRSAMPIIGTMQHSMTVAVTTGGGSVSRMHIRYRNRAFTVGST